MEDTDLIIVNKPSGVLTESSLPEDQTLEGLVSDMIGKEVRCCHRLDKLTSGVVLMRKNRRFTRELAQIIERRQLRKSYWAIVQGIWPKNLGSISASTKRGDSGRMVVSSEDDAKTTKTSIHVLAHEATRNHSWVELLLKTGRTHQARVHCAHVGHPIIGDPLYGSGKQSDFFGLHAREIRFRHPATGNEVKVAAPAPANWSAYLEHR